MIPAKGVPSSTASARCKGVAKRRIVLLVIIALFCVLGFLGYRSAVRFATDIKQCAMFASVEAATELFDSTFGGYPPSDANDTTGSPYCGAMKLAEAMVGQDQMGFHPMSVFRADGLDPYTLAPLYTLDTLKVRPGPFLPLQNATLHKLVDIFGKGNAGPFREDVLVMCDVFERDRPDGKKTGMPVLYYRANTSATLHDVNEPDNPQNIYHYKDNETLIKLGVPGKPGQTHPLADPRRFYLNIQNDRLKVMSRPYRANSYILISAGYDGLYGTRDDICNFDWHYRE